MILKHLKLTYLKLYAAYLTLSLWLEDLFNWDEESYASKMQYVWDYVWGKAVKKERSRYLEGIRDILRAQKADSSRLLDKELLDYVRQAKKPALERLEEARIRQRMISRDQPETEVGMSRTFERNFPLYKLCQLKQQKWREYRRLLEEFTTQEEPNPELKHQLDAVGLELKQLTTQIKQTKESL